MSTETGGTGAVRSGFQGEVAGVGRCPECGNVLRGLPFVCPHPGCAARVYECRTCRRFRHRLTPDSAVPSADPSTEANTDET